MKGISPGRGEIWREKSRDPFCQWACFILHYSMIRAITRHSPSTLDITYYFNDLTLNIGCCRGRPISTMAWRVSEEHQSGVQIGGCGVWRGLWVTLGGGGSLRVALRGGVRQGVRVEGACSSIGDCWKGLGIGSTLKHLWNWEVVGVWRMLKVSEVRVGKTPRQLWSGKQVVPWHCPDGLLIDRGCKGLGSNWEERSLTH